MTKPDLTYWKRKLNGEAPPITAEDPQHGYYRRMNDAIVIRPPADGETPVLGGVVITVNGILVDDPHKASDIWVGCAKTAIDQEIYGSWVEKRMWPEQEAMIKKSKSLNKDMKELVALADKGANKLKERDAKITDEMRSQHKVTTLQNQLEADTAAGFVQQIRAMVGEAEETVKVQMIPVKEQEAEIKRIWTDPFSKLEALQEYFLGTLTEYGLKVKSESNNPDFKFAAGKGGDGKTIALVGRKTLVITDMKAVIERFGKNEDVLAAFHAALLKAATTAWKAEKEAPAGTRVDTIYKAV